MAFAKIIPFLCLACLLHFEGFLPASAQQYRDRPARTLSYLFGSSKTSTTAAAPTTSSQGLPPPPDPPTQISPAQLSSINPVLRTPQLHLPQQQQQRHHPHLIHQQPSQPILYNIRFYPDLSYQQTLQDRVKDKPSGYSFQQVQAQPQPSPVCPYANHHQYVTKIPAPEDVSSPPAKQQTYAAPTQPAPTPASPPAPSLNSISPTAFTPKLLNTRPQQEAQPAGNNYILPLEAKRQQQHQSPLQQQQPYVMTQQHGASSVYLPVLQAAAAAVSQQHQLAQFFQPHHQPYYQPPQPQFPYYSQQLFASQQQPQFQHQRGQQQVSSQKLAPSVYNEYPQYYYYPEYVYVVPVLPQSSQQKQEQIQYPYSVQSFNSNWNTVEDMKRLREEQQQQKKQQQQQPQVKAEKQ